MKYLIHRDVYFAENSYTSHWNSIVNKRTMLLKWLHKWLYLNIIQLYPAVFASCLKASWYFFRGDKKQTTTDSKVRQIYTGHPTDHHASFVPCAIWGQHMLLLIQYQVAQYVRYCHRFPGNWLAFYLEDQQTLQKWMEITSHYVQVLSKFIWGGLPRMREKCIRWIKVCISTESLWSDCAVQCLW